MLSLSPNPPSPIYRESSYIGCFDCGFPEKICSFALAIFATLFFFLVVPPIAAFVYSTIAIGSILTLRWVFFSDSATANDFRHCCLIRSNSPAYQAASVSNVIYHPVAQPAEYNHPPQQRTIIMHPPARSSAPPSFRAIVGEDTNHSHPTTLPGTAFTPQYSSIPGAPIPTNVTHQVAINAALHRPTPLRSMPGSATCETPPAISPPARKKRAQVGLDS